MLLLVAVAEVAFDGLLIDADDELVAADFTVNNGYQNEVIAKTYVLQAVHFELTLP